MTTYVEERKIGKLHWPLIVSVLAISAIGVWNLASAGRAEPVQVWAAQLRWMLLGVFIVAGSLFVDYRVLRGFAWPLYIVTLLMLIAVPIYGREIMGAKRWLKFGPFTVQPSEFAKIAVILMLARYFDGKPTEVRVRKALLPIRMASESLERFWAGVVAWRKKSLALRPKKMVAKPKVREEGFNLLDIWPAFAILFIPVVIVIKQPDLGTGLVTTAIGGSMILFAGLTSMTLAGLTGMGLAASGLAWQFVLKPYQKARVMNFLDPMADKMNTGYHAFQSLIAVGSGQMWGKGWGNGTQNTLDFLPEQHTDFAFPVWAEEHGFVGCAVLVAVYLLLVLSALDIAANARDRFGAFLSFGAAALFFWHAFINIGMVIGLLPVVGVPLLLVSYGGSSAVLTLMAIGVLLNVSLRRTTFQ